MHGSIGWCTQFSWMRGQKGTSQNSPHTRTSVCTKHQEFFFFFFKNVFGGHMSFFGATGTPVLDFWWRLLWVSKPEWVLSYSLFFCVGECNVHSPRFTSGATLADLLAADTQPVTSPHACAEVGLGSVSNVRSHEQKTNALPLCKRPGFKNIENSQGCFSWSSHYNSAKPVGNRMEQSKNNVCITASIVLLLKFYCRS